MYREVSRSQVVIYRFSHSPTSTASDSNLVCVCRSNVYTFRVLSLKADGQRNSYLRPGLARNLLRNVLFELAFER